MAKLTIPEEEHFTRGHTGCPGCGASLAMRYVLKALGQDTIVSIPACCWAVMPGVLPGRKGNERKDDQDRGGNLHGRSGRCHHGQ